MNEFVFLEENYPVTLTSIICSAISSLISAKQSTKSRTAIFIWSLITLMLPGIELLMWYIYLHDFAIDLARNKVSFGFSAMLAGWTGARESKLTIFGGPFIALALYAVIGWILMITPENMANLIYLGVPEVKDNIKSILHINLEVKEKLGSVQIRKYKNGYTRAYKVQLCHIYMLLNSDFWILERNIIKSRWYVLSSNETSSKIRRGLVLLMGLPVYFLVCLTEVIIAFFYYSIPVFGFFVCVVKGFCSGLSKYLSEHTSTRWSRFVFVLRIPLCVVVLLFQIYYLYIFTILFLDSFNFLSRILMFTYTAVVAYPRETYGYFMLIITSISFAFDRLYTFAKVYKRILKLAIKQCKNEDSLKEYIVSKKGRHNNVCYGIPKYLFEYLINSVRPRRVQLLHTTLQLVSIIFFLSVSIEIMVRFQNIEELGFLIHVFIAIFICAMPSIYNSVVSKKQAEIKLVRKIMKSLKAGIRTCSGEHYINHNE